MDVETVTRSFMNSMLEANNNSKSKLSWTWTSTNAVLERCVSRLAGTRKGFDTLLEFSVDYNKQKPGGNFDISSILDGKIFEAARDHPSWLPKTALKSYTPQQAQLRELGLKIVKREKSLGPPHG